MILLMDGRFALRSGGLYGQSAMTPAIAELLADEGQTVEIVCRPWHAAGGYGVSVGDGLRVRHLPDWSRLGILRSLPALARAIMAIWRDRRPVCSVGPSFSQFMLLLLHTLHPSPGRRVFLLRSDPTASLLLAKEARRPFMRLLMRAFGYLQVRLLRGQAEVLVVSRYIADSLCLGQAQIVPEVDWGELEREVGGVASGQRKGALFVGRLEPEKGADRLVAAFADPPMRWAFPISIAGVGSMEGSLRDASASSEIEFVGRLSRRRLFDALASSEVVVVPSRAEAFGLVALEAAVMGCWVVHSGVGGLTEACGWSPLSLAADCERPAQLRAAVLRCMKAQRPTGESVNVASLRRAQGWLRLPEALALASVFHDDGSSRVGAA